MKSQAAKIELLHWNTFDGEKDPPRENAQSASPFGLKSKTKNIPANPYHGVLLQYWVFTLLGAARNE
ncbi:MAG TPA: hypothetical protein DIT98_02680 [Verrucomicrobiales bacterium]|nr:hypothetical protein [Verrucomicrobiales bacterium]